MKKTEYQALFNNENHHWWLKTKRLFLTTLLQEILPRRSKKVLLDIGCGTGKNFEVYKNFANVTAVEISPFALRFARRHKYAKVINASADRLPFPSGSFDIVTIVDVLYHKSIQSDTRVLGEVNRVLKPHGYLLLVDCAHPGLYGPHDVNNHARERYTKRALRTKLTRTRFRIIRSTYLFFMVYPFFVAHRLIEKFITHTEDTSFDHTPSVVNVFIYAVCRVENALLAQIDFPWGSSLAFVCQK